MHYMSFLFIAILETVLLSTVTFQYGNSQEQLIFSKKKKLI